ncbi:MAG: SulP family inorganic anion transporter [Myxococcales bacterium]|nr:SulP family inorganic anion transporter [Myxococcales bacterium]
MLRTLHAMGPRGAWARFLPFLDLAGYGKADVGKDAMAAATATFLAVPQGVAYAMIAGLPPMMGLYASAVPVIVGSLFRSSRHVITGPTNALSLLVGTAGAAAAGLDPIPTALLLAFLVGAIQVTAGVLRLGVLVDYISIPVVIGYITGAGVLIGVGQLPQLTATIGGSGTLFDKVGFWLTHLEGANGWAVGTGLVTAAGILILKKVDKRIPGPMLMLTVVTLASWLLDGHGRYGLTRIGDLSPVPAGLPPLSLPGGEGTFAWSFEHAPLLLPVAVAAAVLSLVESSAVGRAISARSGQRLDLSAEFVGQGLANVTAAFFGGYPTSGSLTRSALNHQIGAASRLAGAASGALMGLVLLGLGPAANQTPVASLAGLLLVVAYDLVDVPRIKKIVRARPSDAAAFVVTVLSTWVLRLDHAIYVGVAVSVVLFMRRARMLTVHRLVFDDHGRLMELRPVDPLLPERECKSIRMVQLEGQLFFGAAGELTSALDDLVGDPTVRVIWLRVRRAVGMDATIAQALGEVATRLRAEGRHLIMVGVRRETLEILRRTGAAKAIGEDNLFSKTATWFHASDQGLGRALELVDEHACDGTCPIERHLTTEDVTPRTR